MHAHNACADRQGTYEYIDENRLRNNRLEESARSMVIDSWCLHADESDESDEEFSDDEDEELENTKKEPTLF